MADRPRDRPAITRPLSPGWERVRQAVRSGVQPLAVNNVIETLRTNRGFIGALGTEELATIVINELLYREAH